MKMLRTVLTAATAALVSMPAMAAAPLGAGETLTEACEIALARSALPARLRERATVHVFRDGAYRPSVKSDGGFHCVVARNHPRSVIPICLTPSGQGSVLDGVVYKATLAMEGVLPGEAERRFKDKADAGEFEAPAEPGINYMMSRFTTIYRESSDSFWNVPPHVMFFAPNVEPEDVGSATLPEAMANKGVPVVVDSGIHAYMVTFVDEGSSPDEVNNACADLKLSSAAPRRTAL